MRFANACIWQLRAIEANNFRGYSTAQLRLGMDYFDGVNDEAVKREWVRIRPQMTARINLMEAMDRLKCALANVGVHPPASESVN